jgi:hypothetical protein
MDMTVMKQVKQDLIDWKRGRVISVMDRGFSSEESLCILQQVGGHYIVGEKMWSGKAAVEEALSRRGRYQQVTYQRNHRGRWRSASALYSRVQSQRSRAPRQGTGNAA